MRKRFLEQTGRESPLRFSPSSEAKSESLVSLSGRMLIRISRVTHSPHARR